MFCKVVFRSSPTFLLTPFSLAFLPKNGYGIYRNAVGYSCAFCRTLHLHFVVSFLNKQHFNGRQPMGRCHRRAKILEDLFDYPQNCFIRKLCNDI